MYNIFGINTTRDISKLSPQISLAFFPVITISKYHSWYLCQISLQIMPLPVLLDCTWEFIFLSYLWTISKKEHIPCTWGRTTKKMVRYLVWIFSWLNSLSTADLYFLTRERHLKLNWCLEWWGEGTKFHLSFSTLQTLIQDIYDP